LRFLSVLFPHLAVCRSSVSSCREIGAYPGPGGCARGGLPGVRGAVGRVHSRYQRQPADTAAGGQEILVRLQVRRFFCDNGGASRRLLPSSSRGLTTRYGRRTRGLDAILQGDRAGPGGRAGARLSGRLACPASPFDAAAADPHSA